MNFYGLFVSEGAHATGKSRPLKLPKGRECQALSDIEKAARAIAKKATGTNMTVKLPFLYWDPGTTVPKALLGPFEKIGRVLSGNPNQKAVAANGIVVRNVKLTFNVQLGYDFVTRNCNGFVGSVLRRAKVRLPMAAWFQIGVHNDFTAWRPWELFIHKKFQEGADNLVKDSIRRYTAHLRKKASAPGGGPIRVR